MIKNSYIMDVCIRVNGGETANHEKKNRKFNLDAYIIKQRVKAVAWFKVERIISSVDG